MLGDCLEKMKEIPDRSVDMVLTDPPYGTTRNKWDCVIDIKSIWCEVYRILKPKSTVAFFAQEPFATYLRMSNINSYKYDWIYQKSHPTGFLNCKKRPLVSHELVCIFGDGNYFPQITKKDTKNVRPVTTKERLTDSYGDFKSGNTRTIPIDMTYPNSVLKFNKDQKKYHPTQKPVALLEYLVKTYTTENETVLDFTMGSGSTGVACKNLNRNFIGIEKDEKYFEIAKKRIEEV